MLTRPTSLQPTKPALTLQPALRWEPRQARLDELAPATSELTTEPPALRPDAPRVTETPSSGTSVAQSYAPVQDAEAPATAGPRATPAAADAAARPAKRAEDSQARVRSAAARPASACVKPAARKRLVTWNRLGLIALVVVLYLGWSFPTERYITPTRGFGYALGIVGGSLMLLLLVYSARKRFRWLRVLGPTRTWFRFHMLLGIVGPLCILFHSNFKTGAANSNVALFCMLTVATSGFVGRYLYAHIHHGLYGRKLQLSELQAGASDLRALSDSVSFLPELATRLEAAEQRLLGCGPRLSVLGFLKPVVVRGAAMKARWQLHSYIRRGLRSSAQTTVGAAASRQLRRTARAYIDRRLAATRRVAEFQGYERLFSLWHALHIPLIFMLLIAAVIHVVAVNVY